MERRNCSKVILKIIEKIPPDKTKFIEKLMNNLEDSYYKAPEEVIQWNRTRETLMEFIEKPKEDWEFEVLSIFTLYPIDVLKSNL